MANLFYFSSTKWKYENPGTADLLSIPGITLTDLPKTKSSTGTAFYQTARQKCFDLPTTSEILIEFDVYFDGVNRWRAFNGGSAGSSGVTAQTNGRLSFFASGVNIYSANNKAKVNGLQTILLYMNAQTGEIKVWSDDEEVYTGGGSVNNGAAFSDIYLQSDGAGTFFSNVTIYNSQVNKVHADLFLKIKNGEQLPGLSYLEDETWIYDNPGTADLLSISGTTLTDLPKTLSRTGVAFRQTAEPLLIPEGTFYPTARQKSIDLPATNEIWIKFDVKNTVFEGYNSPYNYDDKHPYSRPQNQWMVGNAGEYGRGTLLGINALKSVIQGFDRYLAVYLEGSDPPEDEDKTSAIFSERQFDIDNCEFSRGCLQSYLLHMKSDKKNGLTEVWCEGRKIFDYIGNVNGGKNFTGIFFQTPDVYDNDLKNGVVYRDNFFSSVKISNKIEPLLSYEFAIKTKLFATIAPKAEIATADIFLTIENTKDDSEDENKAKADLFLKIVDRAHADTFVKIKRKEKALASTVIRVPHIMKYFLQNKVQNLKASASNVSLVNTFKDYGVTAINIILKEKTLSDDFRFNTTQTIDINEAIQGTLLDYNFQFLVEEITQTDLICNLKGRYNVDDLLYKWFKLTLGEGNLPTASQIAYKLAHYFLLKADVLIEDFTPTDFTTDSMMTYYDVLSSVFGWTSRVAHRQINIFIRGDTLHFIQRGKEISVFDITNLPHSLPTINKKFNRVLCYNPNNDSDDNYDDDDDYKFNGTVSYSQDGVAPFQAKIYVAYTYENGLLIKEQYSTNTGLFADEDGELKSISNYSTTNYAYTTLENKNSADKTYYISSKKNKTKTVEQIWQQNLNQGSRKTNLTTQNTSTSYYYQNNEKSVYLFREHEQTVSSEIVDSKETTEKSWSDIYHVPAGNGWYAQTVYRNGIFQGANLSQGSPGNAVSPYTVKQTQENFKGFDIEFISQKEEAKADVSELSFIVEDSFPVRELETKQKLNNDLRWLHRKIEETVSVNLISPVQSGVPEINHIVDFTERIKFNGAEYFLVSNNISFTPRELIQKLQLIRWY